MRPCSQLLERWVVLGLDKRDPLLAHLNHSDPSPAVERQRHCTIAVRRRADLPMVEGLGLGPLLKHGNGGDVLGAERELAAGSIELDV